MNKTIIKSCLLGLNAKEVDFTAFPKELTKYLNTDKEPAERLLDALSLQSVFLMAGTKCTKTEQISETLPICEDEELVYASQEIHNALKFVFAEKNYSLKTFLPLIIQKMATTNTIIEPFFLPKIVPLLDKQLKDIKSETLQCFGKRGLWIYNMVSNQVYNNSSKPYIEQSRSEKLVTFKNLMQNDKAEALFFLEEIFTSETPANQINYLKNVPLQHFTPEFFNFLKEYFDGVSDNKATSKLKTYFQLMWLHFPESEWVDEAFDNFFSEIWTKKAFLKNTKLVTVTDLKELYSNFGNTLIEDFYPIAKILAPVDQFLFFALVSVPFSKWVDFLEISNTAFVKLVSTISPVDSPKIEMYSFLNALVLNATIHKDTQAAEAIFEVSKFEFATTDFLGLFTPDNLMDKCNSKSLTNSDILIYDLDLNLLPNQWNTKLTKIAIEQCLEITNSRAKLNGALWKIAPYMHPDALDIFDKSSKTQNHSWTLRDEFEEIYTMKIAFDKI